MPRFLQFRIVSFLIGLALCPTLVSAQPSFDCARAGTPTEHAICGSDRLSSLDRDLAAAYAAARSTATAAQAEAIRADQRLWLGQRNECGGQPDCLGNAMRYRLDDLRAIDGSASMRSDLTGIYCPDDVTSLKVVQRGNRMEFGFGLFAGNGHSCGAGGLVGQPSGGGWVARANSCEMSLRQVGNDIVLIAVTPAACKAAYCGARAAIYQLRVPLSSRSPGIDDVAGHNWFEQGC